MVDNVAATLDKEYIRDRKYNSHPGWVITLAAQILCQAIKDSQRTNKKIISIQNKEDAKEWIESDADEYLFDFVNICRLFDIDPQLTRFKIAEGIKVPNLYLKTKEEKN